MNNDKVDEKIKKLFEKGYEFRRFQSFEIRANEPTDAEPESMTIEGVATVFDTPTVLYEDPDTGIEYKEQVDKNAFKECDMSDVIFNYNHSGRVYARTRNDSLHLEVKEDGLHVTVKLNPIDEGHKELYRDIKNGLIDRMSYAYIPDKCDYNTDAYTRTVRSIKKLFDVSAVDIPAYDTTSISARSILDLDKSEREKLESEIKHKREEQRKRIALAIEIENQLERKEN